MSEEYARNQTANQKKALRVRNIQDANRAIRTHLEQSKKNSNTFEPWHKSLKFQLNIEGRC